MLTNAAAKSAGAQARAYKLHDQGGLFLFVTPAGTKSWRLKYRFRGREKLLVLGRFPEIAIPRARILQAEAKELLARGVDPAAARQQGAGTSFEDVARRWHRRHQGRWSKVHGADVIGSLERHVFPAIGARAIGQIGAAELVALLEGVERRGRVETARRLRQRLRQVFAFARAAELRADNPATDIGAALAGTTLVRPHVALTAIEECRQLLAACERDSGRAETILASRFLALTAVRLAAVRGMTWAELDLEALTWTVPAERMKLSKVKKGDARFDHVVPLSPAAVAVLERSRSTTSIEAADLKRLVFPGRDGGPIAAGAIRELYQRAGFGGRHVPHGWRASFSTIMNEVCSAEPDAESWRGAIDMALAHAGKGKVEAAYNRAQLLERRRALFDRWGALLTG